MVLKLFASFPNTKESSVGNTVLLCKKVFAAFFPIDFRMDVLIVGFFFGRRGDGGLRIIRDALDSSS